MLFRSTLLASALLVILLIRMAAITGANWIFYALIVIAGTALAGVGMWRLRLLKAQGARAGNRPPRRVLAITLTSFLVLCAVGAIIGIPHS